MIIKKKKYNLSGLKGFICYSVPYNYEEDYLLNLAYYIHVGNHTITGNGQIEAIACKNNLFAKYIDELRNSGVAEIIEKIENHAYITSTYRSIKILKVMVHTGSWKFPPLKILCSKAMAQCYIPLLTKNYLIKLCLSQRERCIGSHKSGANGSNHTRYPFSNSM